MMSTEPTLYREDLSRLRPGETPERLMLIYEPLDDLITYDWLRCYVWGYRRVSFYAYYDWAHRHKLAESGFQWMIGDIVQSGVEAYRGFAQAEDTVHCPQHGPRRKSAKEARQSERDECCVYVCSACGEVCDETPF